MAAGFKSYLLYLLLLVIDFPDQYKTIHCKSTNKNSVFNKWYDSYYNSLENLNQFINKFPQTFYSVSKSGNLLNFTINHFSKLFKKIDSNIHCESKKI